MEKVWTVQTQYVDGTSMSGGGGPVQMVGAFLSLDSAEEWMHQNGFKVARFGGWEKPDMMGGTHGKIHELEIME